MARYWECDKCEKKHSGDDSRTVCIGMYDLCQECIEKVYDWIISPQQKEIK